MFPKFLLPGLFLLQFLHNLNLDTVHTGNKTQTTCLPHYVTLSYWSIKISNAKTLYYNDLTEPKMFPTPLLHTEALRGHVWSKDFFHVSNRVNFACPLISGSNLFFSTWKIFCFIFPVNFFFL